MPNVVATTPAALIAPPTGKAMIASHILFMAMAQARATGQL